MQSVHPYRCFSAVLILLLSAGHVALASSYGQLKGVIQNEYGQPVPRILVTLLRKSSHPVLPILARTDNGGEIFLENMEAGDYELEVKSSEYQSSQTPRIEIRPGQIAVFTLVLQHLFGLGDSAGPNLSLKSLLRTSLDRRLIFRGLPGMAGGSPHHERFSRPFQNAVFQVYNNGGLGGDYFVFPGGSSNGTTSSFAFSDSLGGSSDYIFAGQLNSGEDSLWRLKNFVNYNLGEQHSLRLFLGYGRMSFEGPGMGLMANPRGVENSPDFVSAVGTVKTMSLGFEDTVRWGDRLALVWGLEWNQVRGGRSDSFTNPSAELSFSPTSGTRVSALMASKRSTQGNTLALPQGDRVNLSDAVYFSQVGNQLRLGTSRYYQSSITQRLNEATELELAAYRNQFFGSVSPFLAILQYGPGMEVLQLDGEQASNQGYRVTIKRSIGEHVKTTLSYIRADGVGVESDRLTFLLDESAVRDLIRRQNYHGLSTQVETSIPKSQTRFTVLVKLVPQGNPITTLDTFSDIYETYNKGVNLFVRQIVPLPPALLGFFGLDFLSTYKIEALLDVRNLTNEDLGLMHSASGDIVLVRNPRTLRGGIALRF